MDKIGELIKRYLEGETTLSEERELRAYFLSSEVDSEFEKYRALFGFFEQASDEKMPSTEEVKVLRISKYKNWYRVAAAIMLPLLCLVGYWSYQSYQEKQEIRLAYLQTERVLQYVGVHLNQGLNKMNYLNTFEEAKNEILNINTK